MKLSGQQIPGTILLFFCSAVIFLSSGPNLLAQATQKLPAPSGQVNDFAGVVNEQTRQQLENILANLKLKTGIEFDIATVESSGAGDIAEFSLQLANDWNVGARTSRKKSLLLVLAVKEKTSFTRFSRSVQSDLPEGVLGEMGQRMRGFFDAGQFGEGLTAGVQHFVNSIGQKLAFSTDDFDKAPASASAVKLPESDPDQTKPASQPANTSASALTDVLPTTLTPAPPSSASAATRTRRATSASAGDDQAESDELDLVLTKPAEERVVLLRTFLDAHPNSTSKARATEMLVSSRASFGDELLRKGDGAGGIEQLIQAIADAPVDASEKLFSGVLYQIPLNLYVRVEAAAATRAAQSIEAKFGNDAKRLVMLSAYYVTTEQGGEAVRLTTQAVQLAPELSEAHLGLGRALHISLRLDEAAVEYKKALDLDPSSKAARRGLADLYRASGKAEEALALYRQQLESEPADKAARAGMILSLFDLGRIDEAKPELQKALETDPRDLSLLAGAAYWFAAHNDSKMAFDLARRAVEIEPRYTWSQIALARSLMAQNRPLDAERALRFARQYGRFPTLEYELASSLLAAGLYDEAAEILLQSFSLQDGQIETRLGGQALVQSANFLELLAPERRASIFQSTAADSENNARLLKALLALATATDLQASGATINEESAVAAAKEFASGDDAGRVHREVYAANRLLQKHIGFQTAFDLAAAARSSADVGMTVPELTVVVQADELRSIRARAIAAGGTPDIPEAPRNVLSNLLRGRIEDTSGWALYNQDKLEEAAEHLRRAVSILPDGTPAASTSLWHLGIVLERLNKNDEALSYYIKSYASGEADPVRRAVIEKLYRQVNGSLAGLDERIGPGFPTSVSTPASGNSTDTVQPAASPEHTPAATPESSSAQHSALMTATSPASTPAQEASAILAQPAAALPTPSPAPSESTPASSSETPSPASSTQEATPTATNEAPPAPAPTSEAVTAPTATTTLNTSPVEKINPPARTRIAITGRVKDAVGNPVANVVVVLISPQGTVLAATTDEQGNYSFTVASSSGLRSYRLIPSRDGFIFEPLDRVLPLGNDDVKELDFVGHFAE